jgi:sugar O-acyltransferase (sialic acid O-acetyltransferase NeuD family)
MKRLRELIIIGAGGFGREVLAWAPQSLGYETEWRIKGFIDDNPDALKGYPAPAPILGTIKDYAPTSDEVFVCGIGIPDLREKVSNMISERGGEFVQLVHRTAVLGNEVSLGSGVVLCPYSLVSSNATIGQGTAVNYHSSVDHDVRVGRWTQISCHCDITAAVQLGDKVFLGSSVSIIPQIKVGDRAYLGAGSVVIRNVPAGARVVGNPARRI